MAKQPATLHRPRAHVEDQRRATPTADSDPAGQRCCSAAAFGQLSLASATWRIKCRGIGECHAYGDGDRLHVGLLRDECTSELYWRIAARPDRDEPPAWWMDFSFRTPPELITAVTVALAADAGAVGVPPPHLRNEHLDDVSAVWQPLVDAQWTITSDEGCHRATSPDQVTTFTYKPPGTRSRGRDELPQSWLLEAFPDPRLVPRWYATSHDETPPHLITAFTTALANLADPVRTGRLRLTFDAAERDAASVRRQVAAHLRCCGYADAVDDAVLATDELFANAVQHGSAYADDSITVTIECGPDHLRIAVTDSSALFPLCRNADSIAEHGRGMAIVAAISDTWGAEAAEDGRGKQVWFTMRVGSGS